MNIFPATQAEQHAWHTWLPTSVPDKHETHRHGFAAGMAYAQQVAEDGRELPTNDNDPVAEALCDLIEIEESQAERVPMKSERRMLITRRIQFYKTMLNERQQASSL